MNLLVRIYGDGAVLDAAEWDYYSQYPPLAEDDGPTADVWIDIPEDVAHRLLHYVSGNNGPKPYSDGYEAMECFQYDAGTVVECQVDWQGEGECYLCGELH